MNNITWLNKIRRKLNEVCSGDAKLETHTRVRYSFSLTHTFPFLFLANLFSLYIHHLSMACSEEFMELGLGLPFTVKNFISYGRTVFLLCQTKVGGLGTVMVTDYSGEERCQISFGGNLYDISYKTTLPADLQNKSLKPKHCL